MTLKFTILGSGSSGGVPRPALGWGNCDPSNPKNRRRRTSLLVERRVSLLRETGEGNHARGPDRSRRDGDPEQGGGGATRVLVDTSPDLREQLLDAAVDRLDGVLYTHEQADHTHGIDDLRSLFIKHRRLIDVYLDEPTAEMMRLRFGYCFKSPPGSGYPPIVRERRLTAGQPITVVGPGGPLTALPFLQEHGDIASLDFRFGSVAYSCDLNGLSPESAAALTGLDVWIVDALRDRPHPSHFSVADALAWIERIEPSHAILTNLHADLDYEVLRAKLPAHVEPAFDGMIFCAAESEDAVKEGNIP
ncbi:MAG: MBL fold metallo-hydrolase [Pseudomonadota bacterium]